MPEPLMSRRKVAMLAKGVAGQARRGLRPPKLSFPYAPPPIPHSVDAPEGCSNIGPDYDTEWARRPSARMARSAIVETMIRPAISAVAKPDRRGYDRLHSLDKEQNALFVGLPT